ncbi:MAG TPA: GDP-mannose 4,6-dehydratase [Promineifilum sp.]|nr:GDP-mannose 4,6-dehydratase [Promineifilum sp.]HRO91801.1 GDP-mannose 4,6-dehydratase [Promineifilum sp.]HRQ13171.1 GDP-mannose 4,6-dehydratase [Promineifilum sp.]
MNNSSIFITGGAGFIGCNSADHFLRQGKQVTIYDNLTRKGGRSNLDWLYGEHGGDRLHLIEADIRDYDRLSAAVAEAAPEVVLHLAGQVAVTSSVVDPREDFEINALGTFNVLEAVRHGAPEAAVLYASTNKVYGGMEDVGIVQRGQRYEYADYPLGVPESFPLDFHSPYGCSKGTGDQYTRDYARIYGLRTLVLRQSCIYGQRQFGVEDQGWVAHFVIATVMGRPIAIYGDGLQVRDVLHVDDLVAAYQAGIDRIDALSGEVFNLGGGPENTLAVWTEFGPLLEELAGRPVPVHYGPWRPGDQRVFVANIQRAEELLGWRPQISPREGITRLYRWVAGNPGLF